jgi:hypothetical protein
MLNIVRKIWTSLLSRRRRNALDDLRREITSFGYALDDLTDAQLESAITRGEGSIEALPPLTGKTLYWILRRVSPDDRQLEQRKMKQVLPI